VVSFEWLKNILFFAGFFFLAYMGWLMWKSTGDGPDKKAAGFSAKRQVAFAASVSLLNPHAIMDTIGVIGTSSLVYSGAEKWSFALACISVSWIWFFGLAIAGRAIGQLDSTGGILKRMNQLSACIVWVMALYMGYQLFQSLGLDKEAAFLFS